MKKITYLLILLMAVAAPKCFCSIDGIYELIETSNADKLRDLLNVTYVTLNKDEKKALLETARRKIGERQLAVNNITLKDAGRVALGAFFIVDGISSITGTTFINQESQSLVGMLMGALSIYLGIENFKKAITHFDNKIKYDRALAIEATLRRIKAKPAKQL